LIRCRVARRFLLTKRRHDFFIRRIGIAIDQGGNGWEWTDTLPLFPGRGIFGDSFINGGTGMHAAVRNFSAAPSTRSQSIGFRVIEVP